MIWDHAIRTIILQQPITTMRVSHIISTSPYFLVNFFCYVMTINDWRFEGIHQLCPDGRRGGAFEPVRQHLSETVINHKAASTFDCL